MNSGYPSGVFVDGSCVACPPAMSRYMVSSRKGPCPTIGMCELERDGKRGVISKGAHSETPGRYLFQLGGGLE